MRHYYKREILNEVYLSSSLYHSICCASTEYQCRYVTCDYSVWSSWSSSCGNGMKRKRTLTKQTQHIKEQQGGCSGLTTTCDREQLETKNTLCKWLCYEASIILKGYNSTYLTLFPNISNIWCTPRQLKVFPIVSIKRSHLRISFMDSYKKNRFL